MRQQLLSNANRGWLVLGVLFRAISFSSHPNLTISGRLLHDTPCDREGRGGTSLPVSHFFPAWVKTAQRRAGGRGFLCLGRDTEGWTAWSEQRGQENGSEGLMGCRHAAPGLEGQAVCPHPSGTEQAESYGPHHQTSPTLSEAEPHSRLPAPFLQARTASKIAGAPCVPGARLKISQVGWRQAPRAAEALDTEALG